MIRGRGTRENGTHFAYFGLSYENLRRLKLGHPIVFDARPFGFPGDIVIEAGETELLLAAELKARGATGAIDLLDTPAPAGKPS